MPNVFVSRPNQVGAEYQRGLEGFLGMLADHDLNPRTIGSTDYPTASPLQAVIELMDKCVGAVILGYPQIVVSQGLVKEEPITDVLRLPTEWNHIEAGLAVARDKPLLVIHHLGVERGIFDRGAINNFIYSKDLTDDAWALDESTRGAVQSWKRHIENTSETSTNRDTLNTSFKEFSANTEPQTIGQSVKISEDEIVVLRTVANDERGYIESAVLQAEMAYSQTKIEYLATELIEKGLLQANYGYVGQNTTYYLTQDGRRKLVELGYL